MNVRILRAGLEVREVPSFEAERIYGESNLQAIPDGLRVMRTIFHERFKPLSDAMRAHARSRAGGQAADAVRELEPVSMGMAMGGVREAAGEYMTAMSSALHAIDVTAVLQLAERLRMARDRSRTIHLLADPSSFDAAEKLALELRRNGDTPIPVRVRGPVEAQHGAEDRAEPGDVLLIFATDGNDPDLVAAAHAARRDLVDSVAVIGIDGGLLARETDHLVLTNAARSAPRTVASLHAIVSDIVMTALTHDRSAVAQLSIEQLTMGSAPVPLAGTTERLA
jgi:DNA-binding MurR/RpiR family transcriptional regulator